MSGLSKEFSARCKTFFDDHSEKRDALQSCLEENVNSDVNRRCKKLKEAYLLAIAKKFCGSEYEITATCQKEAGNEWASRCFKENTEFAQCLELTLKKLYRYGMENSMKNPAPSLNG